MNPKSGNSKAIKYEPDLAGEIKAAKRKLVDEPLQTSVTNRYTPEGAEIDTLEFKMHATATKSLLDLLAEFLFGAHESRVKVEREEKESGDLSIPMAGNPTADNPVVDSNV